MSKHSKGNITKVHPANKAQTSVKTSIPSYLTAKYDISVGDILEWNDDGEYILIRKAQPERMGE